MLEAVGVHSLWGAGGGRGVEEWGEWGRQPTKMAIRSRIKVGGKSGLICPGAFVILHLREAASVSLCGI